MELITEVNKTEKPAIEMEEEAEYKRQLALFVSCSTEKGIELSKLGETIAGIPHRQKFMDIGTGGGDLTIPLSQSFQETTVIELNTKQANFLRRRCPKFNIIEST